MRVKGIVFLLIVAVLVFLISWISVDSMIEEEIEYQASIANGALVEIDGLDIDIIDLKVRWDKLQVTNPENTMSNTFETGEMELDFLFWPTWWERVIVEDVVLKGLKMDTERETDGYFEIPEGEEDPDAEAGFVAEVIGDVTSEISQNAKMQFTDIKTDLNVDSLMAELDLRAPEKIDSLKNGIEQNYQKWDSTFANTGIDKEIASIEKAINAIDVKSMKDPKKAIAAIKDVQKMAKQVDSLKANAEGIKKGFQEDLSSAKFSTGNIDKWIEEDYRQAMDMAKLPTIDAGNIAQSIFGKNLVADYAGYMEYVAIARKYGSQRTNGEDEEKIERYEGKDYKFSDKYDWPKLWIQNINLSGETKTAIKIAGQITNISSDQKKTKEPIKFNIGGKDDGNREMKLTGEFNYLGEEPTEAINFSYNGFSLAGTKISPSELLPYPLNEGAGEVSASVSIVDKRFDSEIDYSMKGLSFNFGENLPQGQVQQLIRDAVSDASQIDVSALIDNVNGPLDVKIRSNLDDLFVNALKGTVSKEVDQARQKIESEVQNRIGNRKEELLVFKKEKEAEIRKKSEQLENRVNDVAKKAESKKKELEKKKKELEDALKNKLKDKIGF